MLSFYSFRPVWSIFSGHCFSLYWTIKEKADIFLHFYSLTNIFKSVIIIHLLVVFVVNIRKRSLLWTARHLIWYKCICQINLNASVRFWQFTTILDTLYLYTHPVISIPNPSQSTQSSNIVISSIFFISSNIVILLNIFISANIVISLNIDIYLVPSPSHQGVNNIHRVVTRPLQYKPEMFVSLSFCLSDIHLFIFLLYCLSIGDHVIDSLNESLLNNTIDLTSHHDPNSKTCFTLVNTGHIGQQRTV